MAIEKPGAGPDQIGRVDIHQQDDRPSGPPISSSPRLSDAGELFADLKSAPAVTQPKTAAPAAVQSPALVSAEPPAQVEPAAHAEAPAEASQPPTAVLEPPATDAAQALTPTEPIETVPDQGVQALVQIRGLNVVIGPNTTVDAVLNQLRDQHGWQDDDATRRYVEAGIDEARKQHAVAEAAQAVEPSPVEPPAPREVFVNDTSQLAAEIAQEGDLTRRVQRTVTELIPRLEDGVSRQMDELVAEQGDTEALKTRRRPVKLGARKGPFAQWNKLEEDVADANVARGVAGVRFARDRAVGKATRRLDRGVASLHERVQEWEREEERLQAEKVEITRLKVFDDYLDWEQRYNAHNARRPKVGPVQRARLGLIARLDARTRQAQALFDQATADYQAARQRANAYKLSHHRIVVELPREIAHLNDVREGLGTVGQLFSRFQERHINQRAALESDRQTYEAQLNRCQAENARLTNLLVEKQKYGSTLSAWETQILTANRDAITPLNNALDEIRGKIQNATNPEGILQVDLELQNEHAVVQEFHATIGQLLGANPINTGQWTARQRVNLVAAYALFGEALFHLHPEARALVLGETTQIQATAAEPAPPQPPAEPSEPHESPTTDALPSPEEALTYLEGLTAGKEDELRIEAEQAGDERLADLGLSSLSSSPRDRAGTTQSAPVEDARPIDAQIRDRYAIDERRWNQMMQDMGGYALNTPEGHTKAVAHIALVLTRSGVSKDVNLKAMTILNHLFPPSTAEPAPEELPDWLTGLLTTRPGAESPTLDADLAAISPLTQPISPEADTPIGKKADVVQQAVSMRDARDAVAAGAQTVEIGLQTGLFTHDDLTRIVGNFPSDEIVDRLAQTDDVQRVLEGAWGVIASEAGDNFTPDQARGVILRGLNNSIIKIQERLSISLTSQELLNRLAAQVNAALYNNAFESVKPQLIRLLTGIALASNELKKKEETSQTT